MRFSAFNAKAAHQSTAAHLKQPYLLPPPAILFVPRVYILSPKAHQSIKHVCARGKLTQVKLQSEDAHVLLLVTMARHELPQSHSVC